MAKPINATPSLNLEESIRFVKNMIKTENRKKLTKFEKEVVKAIINDVRSRKKWQNQLVQHQH